MNSTKMKCIIFAIAIAMWAPVAMAQNNSSMEGSDHMKHEMAESKTMDHGSLGHEMAGNHATAEGVGVVHKVSKLNRTVNVTHEPIPALKWPEMTMDLPVAKSVDISHLKSGDKIKFRLELSEDNQYVITHIEM